MSHHVLIRHPCEVVAPCPENDGNKSGIDQRENALICTLPPRVVDITKSFGPRPTCERGTERAEYFNIHVQSRNDLNCVKTLGCPVPCQLRKLAVCHSVTETVPPGVAQPQKRRAIPAGGVAGVSFSSHPAPNPRHRPPGCPPATETACHPGVRCGECLYLAPTGRNVQALTNSRVHPPQTLQ